MNLEKELLWEFTKKYSGIPKDYFDDYFQGREFGYAIKIKKSKLYESPLDLKHHYKINYPPQSFMYL